MADLTKVVEKYREFSNFLNEVDLSDINKKYSRKELQDTVKNIRNIDIRSMTLEISRIEEKMKLEEHPELLEVHNFPILKKIDFLSEEKKIELDRYLVRLRVGNYVAKSGLYTIARKPEVNHQLIEWLKDNGVIAEQWLVNCINCSDTLGKVETNSEKAVLDNSLKAYRETYDYQHYERIMDVLNNQDLCMECDILLDDMLENYSGDFMYEPIYKMQMERDRSLDNV